MMKHTEVREKMATLLEDLPDIVEECEQYSEIYPGRDALHLCVNEVYVVVLMALEDMIHWYEQSWASESLQRL
jgi:hypothetical protein